MQQLVSPLKYIALFIICFCGTIIILNNLLPKKPIDLGLATAKLNYLKTHAQDYNILFIGSSRTHRMIDSKAIETQLHDRGCNYRVFNMGFANLTLEESDYILNEILSIPNNNFQMIIIDEPLTGHQKLDKARSERAQMLRTWSNFKRRHQNIWSYQDTTLKKLYRTAVNLYGYGYTLLNLGNISKQLFPDAYNTTTTDSISTIEKERATFETLGGFKILENDLDTNLRAKTVHEQFISNKDNFQKKLDRSSNKITQAANFSGQARAKILNQQLKKIEDNGISSGFYIAPLPDRIAENKDLANHLNIEALNYNDPRALPMIWDTQYWFDPYHLNREGARIMSQDIGRKLHRRICPSFAESTVK